MNKKILTLSLLSPVVALPVLTTVACASTSSDSSQVGNIGNSELSKFVFLMFKSEVISIVNNAAANNQVMNEENLQKLILSSYKWNGIIKDLEVTVTKENNNFIINYKMNAITGTLDDVALGPVSKTEPLSGSFAVPVPAENN